MSDKNWLWWYTFGGLVGLVAVYLTMFVDSRGGALAWKLLIALAVALIPTGVALWKVWRGETPPGDTDSLRMWREAVGEAVAWLAADGAFAPGDALRLEGEIGASPRDWIDVVARVTVERADGAADAGIGTARALLLLASVLPDEARRESWREMLDAVQPPP